MNDLTQRNTELTGKVEITMAPEHSAPYAGSDHVHTERAGGVMVGVGNRRRAMLGAMATSVALPCTVGARACGPIAKFAC